jgi:hypothetical protein
MSRDRQLFSKSRIRYFLAQRLLHANSLTEELRAKSGYYLLEKLYLCMR